MLRRIFCVAAFLTIYAATAASAMPASLGSGSVIIPGVRAWSTTLKRPGGETTLWIYLPDPAPAGKIPCVFIAPAGSPLIFGMDLSEDDRLEQVPYALAGMAVVAYSVSGPGDDKGTVSQNMDASAKFMKAHAGLTDAKAAIDYAVANLDEIDTTKLYTAGHSSAATLSLLVAEFEPRIAACVAYAPICDIITFQNHGYVDEMDNRIDGFKAFLRRASPITAAAKLKCPVFLFHAEDDDIAPNADIDVFYDTLTKTNRDVTFVRVPTGGHYEAMVETGIPKAIEWLKGLSK